MICWDLRRDVAARYWWEPGRITSAYLLGGTLLMRRSFWEERPYEDISLGEDNEFIQGCVADGMGIAILPDYTARALVPAARGRRASGAGPCAPRSRGCRRAPW